jgi:hypothetical protein
MKRSSARIKDVKSYTTKKKPASVKRAESNLGGRIEETGSSILDSEQSRQFIVVIAVMFLVNGVAHVSTAL